MQPQNSRFFRISKRTLSTLLLTLSAENYHNIHTSAEKTGSNRQTGLQRANLLPFGYIEAEAYRRDLDALTGPAQTQNARCIENLDNFILTNFVEFRLYTEGTLRATAHAADGSENLERLLDRFLRAGPVQIATPEALAKHLARRTRELQTQIATTLTTEQTG